ncbi:hypothetical protein ACQR5T_17790 [Xanthomonas oryzae pv. oryzicola]|uniref:hypothetical protein n=1 Tax=Xanthomonas oryzae TaxID=347 RepID=UPI0012B031EC|nr:hypothetical protein [Xanthomonas oryzae]
MKIDSGSSASAYALMVLAVAAMPRAHAQSYFGSPVEGTLCKAGETVMFACHSKEKQIAVCAAAAGGSPFGALRYRFGSSSNTELEFPAQPVQPRQFASGNRLGDGTLGVRWYTCASTTATLGPVNTSEAHQR